MDFKRLFIILLMIFFFSCKAHQEIVIPQKEIPLPFLELSYDPNDISVDNGKKIDLYSSILESSPVPIFIMNQNDLPLEVMGFLDFEEDIIIYGLYVPKPINDIFTEEFIFINSNMSIEMMMTTYFHEIQHYNCKETGCYCFDEENYPEEENIILSIFKEKHAMENELRMSLELEDVHLLVLSISSITNYILSEETPTYQIAALSVAQGQLWIDSTTFLLNIE